jgi:hypothetical protein
MSRKKIAVCGPLNLTQSPVLDQKGEFIEGKIRVEGLRKRRD